MNRFDRQERHPSVGAEGQARLARSHVLVVGCGGLGAPAALALAAAGVGHLTLVDPDTVSIENLHRQTPYREFDVGRPKVEALREQILARHADCKVDVFDDTFEEHAADLAVPDLVLDGTDRIPVRYLLSAWSRQAGVPLLHAALDRDDAQMVLLSPDGPCYRCIYPEMPQGRSCSEAGILGPWAQTIALLQADWATRVLLGLEVPTNQLYNLRAPMMDVQRVRLLPRGDCSHLPPVRAQKPRGRLVDVRSQEEWDEGHAPDAIHMPLPYLDTFLLTWGDAESLVFVCEVGARAQQAKAMADARGIAAEAWIGSWRDWR